MDYARLKARHRAERDGYPQNLSLRVHRALSWLDRAERAGHELKATGRQAKKAGAAGKDADLDARFIFLWIALNAAYATEIDEGNALSEQQTFRRFLRKLLHLDTAGRIEDLVWSEFPQSIRLLLDNPYVLRDFWAWQNGRLTEAEWQRKLADDKRKVARALAHRRTNVVLGIVLSRIYTLRNQLIHGGATWNGKVNRAQIRDCTRFMARLAPLVIEIMMDHPETLWGDPCYPVVDGA
jgi:hypothetical protein